MEKRPIQKTGKIGTSKSTKTLIRLQFDNTYTGTKGPENNQPSMTTPDMSLTVKKLLINHSRGISSNVHYNEPLYFDTEIPIINDLNDLADYQEELKQREKELKQQLQDEHLKKLATQNPSPTPDTTVPKPKPKPIDPDPVPKTDPPKKD